MLLMEDSSYVWFCFNYLRLTLYSADGKQLTFIILVTILSWRHPLVPSLQGDHSFILLKTTTITSFSFNSTWVVGRKRTCMPSSTMTMSRLSKPVRPREKITQLLVAVAVLCEGRSVGRRRFKEWKEKSKMCYMDVERTRANVLDTTVPDVTEQRRRLRL